MQLQHTEQMRQQQEQMQVLVNSLSKSSATIAITPPKSLNVETEEINKEFDRFRREFESYLKVTDAEKLPVDQQGKKLDMLMLFIGGEAREKFRDFELTDGEKVRPIEEILDLVEKRVKKDEPLLLLRHEFHLINQEEGEKYDDYHKRVVKTAERCSFVNISKDTIIRDRLVLGIFDPTLKKKLFEKNEAELTVEEVRKMGRANEATNEFMTSTKAAKEKSVELLKEKQDFSFKDKINAGKSRPTCTYCKNPGHTEAVCYKKHGRPTYQKSKGQSRKPSNKKNIKEVDEDSDESTKINSIIDRSAEGKGVKAELLMQFNSNWVDVACDIDTGAGVCIVGYDWLCAMLGTDRPRLENSTTKLSNVSKDTIKVLGATRIRIIHKKVKYNCEFQVVDIPHGPLLGANASKSMGLIKFCNKIDAKSNKKDVIKIPEELKKEAENIISKYRDVFNDTLGKFPGKVTLQRDPKIPAIHERPRRFPGSKKKILKEELEKLIEKGLITKHDGPTDFLSNILLVSRGDKHRICLDPINLNKTLKNPGRQQTTLDEILPDMAAAKIFTTVDAAKGYWQVELDEESSLMTTFSTPFGNYRWLRMPFGISPASAIFSSKLAETMQGVEGVEALADDIIISGSGRTITEAMEDHNHKLRALLKRMRANGCKLNKDKLKLCQTNVLFFGHLLTTDGIQPDDSKIEAIRDYPRPQDKKSVQRFLGMVTYLGRYIPSLSHKTATLRELTHTRARWQWGEAEEEEFVRLKHSIIMSTKLQYFDVKKPIVLECDASDEGLGVALMQEGKPIAFASRTLSEAERNSYAPIEKEMSAIVFGCSRFHQMLIGNHVTVRTDHRPLVNISSKPLHEISKRLQCMSLFLQKYDLNIVHVQGKDNWTADALSRAPIEAKLNEDNIKREKNLVIFEIQSEDSFQHCIKNLNPAESVVTNEREEAIRKATSNDPTLQGIMHLVRNGWPDNKNDLRDDIKVYWQHRHELSCHNGVVLRGKQVVIPRSQQKIITEKVHQAHNGIQATILFAAERVFWPSMKHQIEDRVRNCTTCAKYSASQKKLPMKSHEVPDYPFQYVSMDCCETTIGGRKKNLLITVDHYSDFFEIDVISDMTPGTVISASKTNFARHGIPQRVCTDNGTNFVNQQMKRFAEEYKFQHVTSSPNHQQGNGKAEAAVKIAKNLIKKSEEEKTDYKLALLHWRNTPNKIGSSPCQRLMSRSTQTLLPSSTEALKPKVITGVPGAISRNREEMKTYYDRKTQQRNALEKNQKVFVQLNQGSNQIWTPAVVAEKLNDREYVVNTGNGMYRRNEVFIKPTASPSSDEEETDNSFMSAQEDSYQATPPPPPRDLRNRNEIKRPARYND